MDPQERKNAQAEFGIYQAVLLAMEHRHDVVEEVWESSDTDEARQRLRDQLGVDETGAQVVLDLQIHKLTAQDRQRIAGRAHELGGQLGIDGPSPT